jgi:hypothetical protein
MSNVDVANLAYDPDQDPEEKRQVRKEYRSLHKDTEGVLFLVTLGSRLKHKAVIDKRANLNDYTAEQLVDRVLHADSLFDKGVLVAKKNLSPTIDIHQSRVHRKLHLTLSSSSWLRIWEHRKPAP